MNFDYHPSFRMRPLLMTPLRFDWFLHGVLYLRTLTCSIKTDIDIQAHPSCFNYPHYAPSEHDELKIKFGHKLEITERREFDLETFFIVVIIISLWKSTTGQRLHIMFWPIYTTLVKRFGTRFRDSHHVTVVFSTHFVAQTGVVWVSLPLFISTRVTKYKTGHSLK